MEKHARLPIFAAGIGIGVAATLLLTNRGLRTGIGKTFSNAPDPDAMLKRGEKAMSNVKDKLKNKIDDAAEASKKAVDKVVDKSKDAAHKAGEQLERGGKRLQDA
jgi:hypothetical protein